MKTNWTIQVFSELTAYELYAIIRLRNEVFVVEQNCVFQDADNHDQVSHHICGWKEGKIAAYARVLPPGEIYEQPSIGRVVTARSSRKQQTGKELMQNAISFTQATYVGMDITIGAQLYLLAFYGSLGFKKTGDIYLEDGIEHIKMNLKFVQ
ncbi:MAG: GNAT family N-acetyltransferase [Chitinophagaceae bacterium]